MVILSESEIEDRVTRSQRGPGLLDHNVDRMSQAVYRLEVLRHEVTLVHTLYNGQAFGWRRLGDNLHVGVVRFANVDHLEATCSPQSILQESLTCIIDGSKHENCRAVFAT